MNLRVGLVSLMWIVLAGCVGSPNSSHPRYAPAEPVVFLEEPEGDNQGAIFRSGRDVALFEDFRAKRVGDIVTVLLAEATEAEKSSDTSINKNNNNTIDDPILLGQTRTIGGDALNFDLSSNHAFSGEGESNQSNSLQGSITVTVAKVLPGGNLYVQGEKWIKINQGDEYIRLRGIIRPADISTSNTVMSTKVADARISYSGTGTVAQANSTGWLSKFFLSPLWPF